MEHKRTGAGPTHDWDCPACVERSEKEDEYRKNNNPHRPGTKVHARWDRERSSLAWAMDMRGETYWSA